MGEAVTGAPTGHLGDETSGGSVLDSSEERISVKLTTGLNEGEIELEADDCRYREGGVGAAGEAAQPAPHRLPNSVGDIQRFDGGLRDPAVTMSGDGTGLSQVAQHLADEEGIPLRLGVNRPG